MLNGTMVLAKFKDIGDQEEMNGLIDKWIGTSLMSSTRRCQDSPSLWLLDSGASFHMIRLKDVIDAWARTRKSKEPPPSKRPMV